LNTGNYWDDVGDPRDCELLAAYPGVVRRNGPTLIVKLKNETTVYYYDDEDDDGRKTVIYRVWDISPDRRYVTLWIGYFEGGTTLLIDRATGEELDLDSPPRLSPNGRYWAAVDDTVSSGVGQIVVVGRRFGKPSVIASSVRMLCNFNKWDSDTSFLMTCYDDETSMNAELRVTWDKAGSLTTTPTGRTTPAGS
jgi:hypothetical protein